MAISRNTVKQIGRGIALIGVAVVAWSGWLKADNNSMGVFWLFVAGVAVWIVGAALIRYGKSAPGNGREAGPRDDDQEA
jgi:hypothetical protein